MPLNLQSQSRIKPKENVEMIQLYKWEQVT